MTLQFPGGGVDASACIADHRGGVTPTTREPTDWELFAGDAPAETPLDVLVRVGISLDLLLDQALVRGHCADQIRAARSRITAAVSAYARGR